MMTTPPASNPDLRILAAETQHVRIPASMHFLALHKEKSGRIHGKCIYNNIYCNCYTISPWYNILKWHCLKDGKISFRLRCFQIKKEFKKKLSNKTLVEKIHRFRTFHTSYYITKPSEICTI